MPDSPDNYVATNGESVAIYCKMKLGAEKSGATVVTINVATKAHEVLSVLHC